MRGFALVRHRELALETRIPGHWLRGCTVAGKAARQLPPVAPLSLSPDSRDCAGLLGMVQWTERTPVPGE